MGRTGRGGGKGKMVCALSRSPKPKLRFGDTKGKIGKDTENLNGLETNTQAVLFSLECCQFGVLDRCSFSSTANDFHCNESAAQIPYQCKGGKGKVVTLSLYWIERVHLMQNLLRWHLNMTN